MKLKKRLALLFFCHLNWYWIGFYRNFLEIKCFVNIAIKLWQRDDKTNSNYQIAKKEAKTICSLAKIQLNHFQIKLVCLSVEKFE